MTFKLISRSTTTGWLDWEHGELWLAPDGLLRRRRGWANTIASVGLMRDLRARTTDAGIQEEFTNESIDLTVQQGGLWIPAETIRAARLRPGIITGRLGLTLADGQLPKLLWAKSRLTYDSLHGALIQWLNGQLRLD
jgi:hypothetical protein